MNVSAKSAGAKLLLLTLLSAAGLLASATAATVYAAGRTQRSVGGRATSSTAVNFDAARHWESIQALSDSLLEPLGPRHMVDSTTLRAVVALVAVKADSARWIPHGAADTARTQSLATFRRWARSEPLPAFWGLRVGMAGIADHRAIPSPRLQIMKQLWKANEAQADSALVRGDAQTALERARENIAGARHLMFQPWPISALVGRVMMMDGAKLLARSALQADQPALKTAALRLEAMSRALAIMPRGGLSALNASFADPHDDHLPAMARDRSLPPATRYLAVELMVAATCLSTRDVLFGPSQARHAAVDAMFDDTRDISRMNELRPLFHRTLTVFDESPERDLMAASVRQPADEAWGETLLRLVVPRKVQARVDFCRQFGA